VSFNAGKRKLSGAERRKFEKQKQIAEGALLKKIPKVSTYFCAHTQPDSSSQMSSTLVSSELAEEEGMLTEDTSDTLELHEEDNETALLVGMEEQGDAIAITSDEGTGVKFPPTTDIAYFGAKTLTVFEKQFILRAGSLQPNGPFPKQTEGANKGRSFSEYISIDAAQSLG